MIIAQLQVLICLHNSGRSLELQEIYHQFKIGKFYPLSDEALGETYGQESFTHEIRSTLNVLKKKYYVENPTRSVWCLSELGRLGMAKLDKKVNEAAKTERESILNRWEDYMVKD